MTPPIIIALLTVLWHGVGMENELLKDLQARNAKTLAWVAESPETRWACTLVEDPAHWAGYGVRTPAELEHHLLVSEAFEVDREAHGFKPSWSGLMAMDNEALRLHIERCSEAMEEARANEMEFFSE